VFEGFDKAGVLRAICGGGRYDRLISLYGSPKEVPCVGFGFGDCVIAELLKEKNVKPDLPAQVDFVVAAFSADFMGKALSVARKLRQAGKSVDIFTEPGKKLGKAYNYADRIGARKLALVAPSFTADCIETLEELGVQGREEFEAAGGEELVLVPCLNSSTVWVRNFAKLLLEQVAQGSLRTAAASSSPEEAPSPEVPAVLRIIVNNNNVAKMT